MKKEVFLLLFAVLTGLLLPGRAASQVNSQAPRSEFRMPNGQKYLQGQAPAFHLLTACTPDSLVLTRQGQVDSFPLLYAGCTVLRKLTVDGSSAVPAITRLDSLKYITQVTEELRVSRTSISSLSGFQSLAQVDGFFVLDYNPQLTATNLTTLTKVGLIILDSLPNLTNVSGLTTNLTNGGVGTIFVNNTGLSNLSGFEGITSVANMYIWFNKRMKSLQGMNNITQSPYGISVFFNDSLLSCAGLGNITNISDGTLEIANNQQLSSLTGLSAVGTLGGGLWINHNNSLQNLNALNASLVIQNNNLDSVRIFSNQTLSACSWAPICNYLNSGGGAKIFDNAAGCNSTADVLLTCNNCITPGTKTWNGSSSTAWDNPANWTPAGVPASCDSVVIPRYPVYGNNTPSLSQTVTVRALTMGHFSELLTNGQNLIINGNLLVDSGDIAGGGQVFVNRAHTVKIVFAYINVSNFYIKGYKGNLLIDGNVFQHNLAIEDSIGRTGTCKISGNYVYGNLSLTAQASNPLASVHLSENEDDQVHGSLTLKANSPALFQVGMNADLYVGGSFIINSNQLDKPYLNRIYFFGGAVNIRGQSTNSQFAHITQLGTQPIRIQNASTGKTSKTDFLVLDQDVFIANDFQFGTGVVKADSLRKLVFLEGAGTSQLSSESYVWGPVKKIGNQAFTFPVGDSIYTNTFAMSAPAQTTDAFTGQYFHRFPGAAGFDTALHAASLNRVSGKEYWQLQRNNGTSNVAVTLRFDSLYYPPLRSLADLRVARWNGSQWADEGKGSVSGNRRVAFVTSASPQSSLGGFTLGFVPARVPVITIGNMDSLACRNQFIKVPVLLDTLMMAGNEFTVQLSDSTGSFALPSNIGAKISSAPDTIQAFISAALPLGNGHRIRVIGSQPFDTSINTKPLFIGRGPVGFSIAGPAVACLGVPTKYYASQKQTGVFYSWQLTQGNATITAVADTVWLTPTASASVTLQLTASNTCGTTTSSLVGITILPPPPTSSPSLTKRGRWLDASKPLPAGASAYRWYRNDTLIAAATGASYYASQSGSYKVQFANSCGNGPASNSETYAVASSPQSITFSFITDKVFSDSSFTVNATASSALPVEFQVVSGPGNIPGNVFNITGAGTVVLQVTQPGNDLYDTAAHILDTFVVNKASQTLLFNSLPDRILTATPIALLATTTSALPIAYSVVSGPATITSNQLTITGVGTVTVRAAQAGNNNYLAALPVNRSFCVRVANLDGINGPVSICPGIAATYTTRKVPGATYTWRLQGGSTLPSTNDTLRYTWPSAGTYKLIVSAAGSCGEPSRNDTLTVTAVTSVAPDSVRNMLPADGALNQQLPLQLSWIPANPALYYTYDLYVWKVTDPQPATPYRNNLTAGNFTLTLASGLQFNTTYKWMVVASNGSCTQISTGPIQQFSLIPLPDLQVFNVTAPATAFSGQPVSVTWKVKNNGPGNTALGQRWTDAVYISKDSVLRFSSVDAQLAFPIIPKLMTTRPNVSALNAGEEYRDTATFLLPIDYSGPLHFHVVTNYQPPFNNAVIETTYGNDTTHALPLTMITLSPQPDLRVDTVLNPGNTFSGSTINVTYKVKNYSVTGTGNWTDKIYLSKDAVFNPATALRLYKPNSNGAYFPQTPLDLNRNNSSLQADSSYTISVAAVVPNFIFGQYYVYVATNATATLYEGAAGQNNVNRGPLLQIFLTQTPKLVPGNIRLPSVITTAQTVSVSWDTRNLGAYDNIQKSLYPYGPQDTLRPWGFSRWYDRVFLSTDSTNFIVNNDLKIAETLFYNAIYPANVFSGGEAWIVPDNLPTGDYWLHVLANATRLVFEYPGLPQTAHSQKITVVKPDLSVLTVTAPATGASGQPVSVNYAVQNSSSGEVSNRFRKDYFYLGTNPAFDGTAVLIDSAVYTAYVIPANGNVVLQKSVHLPNGVSGAKYLFVKANGAASFSETTFTNNSSSGSLINVLLTPPPDLTVTTINVAATVYTNTGFPFAYTVANVGSGVASGAWKDSIYVSCNSTFNSSTAYYVAERIQQLFVPASNSYTDSFLLKMPQTFLLGTAGCLTGDAPQLYFFVKTNANNGVFEVNRDNNLYASAQKTVINTLVDHIVTSVSAADTLYVGRVSKVGWTVKNLGLNPADHTYAGWFDGIYLSTDTVLSANDRFLTHKSGYQRLAQQASYKDSLLVLTGEVPTGTYYVFVQTNFLNNLPAERKTDNNGKLRRNANGAPLPVYVALPAAPDLIVTILVAPTYIAAGQPLKLVYTVTNNGAGTTYGAWADNIWLSNSLSPGGRLLDQHSINRSLQPGQSYTDSVLATLPLNYGQGNYVMVVHAGASGGVFESNYSNNYAYRYLSVYTPAPADLLVENISVADTVILGYPASVNWKLRNNSANPVAGTETDGIYLSPDSTVGNSVDVLIGTKENRLNLLPLNDTALTLQPVFSGVAEGSYYLKVRTDILRNIPETNTGNNTALLNKKVFVKVKALPLAVSTPDVLTNTYLYYKLMVPTALKGKTIRVKLTSTDSLTAANQLFLGLGYVPSAAKFDYSHSAASGGNQQIVIESAVDSVYYIAARSGKPGMQTVKLEAIELPFALMVVNSNRGGNSGNVTVKLSGTLFSNNMTARLRGTAQNNTLTAVNFYFINGTTAYASFNLRGAPLGMYDVALTKPDNSVALLANSFTVEATNSGGLLTGGTNTGQTGSGLQPGCDPGAAGGLNTQLQTELIIPPKVFADWPFVITINFTNSSNVDIPAQVRVLYSHDGAPLALTEDGLAAGKTSVPIEFKDAFGAPNVIRAGSSGTLKVYSKAPPSAGAHSYINFNLQ